MRKPLLVGGVGLSFLIWLWSSLEQSLERVGEYGTLGLLIVGAAVWGWQRRRTQTAAEEPVTPQLPLQPTDLEAAIAAAEATIARLEAEGGTLTTGRERLAELPATLERDDLLLAAIGRPGVGKTSLLAALDLPATVETLAIDLEGNLDALSLASDLTLFVVEGDLSETEFQALRSLQASRHRLLLVSSKCDRHPPEERAAIAQSLQQRVAPLLPANDTAIATAAAPSPLKVRREQPDGSQHETQEAQLPDVAALESRIEFALAAPEDLCLATAWRQATAIAAEARRSLNARRRDRALPVVERYQWISAAAAFANPVGTLDLLATSAVSAQLALDLGEIYQRRLSLPEAQAIANALGKQMVQLGIVELSTQTVGSLLKSHALTYVAGGAVQGVSAAYLTRLAGLSLIEAFATLSDDRQGSSESALASLQHKLQSVFALTKRASLIESLFAEARARLPLSKPSKVAPAGTSQ